MNVTPDQIRAARALLKWGQNDLAARSGVSVPAIANIETERQKPNVQTMQKLLEAFSLEGIEFIDGGVRKAQNLVRILEGDDAYIRLLDEVFLKASPEKAEVLFSAADDRRSAEVVVEKTRMMRRSGIPMKFLVKDGDTYLMGKLDEYRWMPEELYVDAEVKLIYADCVAYYIPWRGTPRVVIVQDKHIAEENRRGFYYVWNNSKTPSKTTAETFYD